MEIGSWFTKHLKWMNFRENQKDIFEKCPDSPVCIHNGFYVQFWGHVMFAFLDDWHWLSITYKSVPVKILISQ